MVRIEVRDDREKEKMMAMENEENGQCKMRRIW
jgi:hypothetical protein